MGIRRGNLIVIIMLSLLILPLVSSEIIINTQPTSVYNLGSIVNIPVTLKTTSGFQGNFLMDLICGTNDINFYSNGVALSAGEQKNIEASLVLLKGIIGNVTGDCVIKALMGPEYVLTNSFKISDSITISSNLSKTEFNPGDSILVKGSAIREDSTPVNGYVEVSVIEGNSSLVAQEGTVSNGVFSLNITFPSGTAAGNYIIRTDIYEKDSLEEITNNGVFDKEVTIDQVPTNLEIVFENSTVEPGTNLTVKAILHDQTGVSMNSQTYLTVKDDKNKILDQTELSTDQFLEYPIAFDTPPANWTIVAVSNKLTSDSSFEILENENASIEITNNTVLITNTGNVPYNNTVLVKIGNRSMNLDVYLKVDQSQEWILTAPSGNYDVQIFANGAMTGASVALTGNEINIKKASIGGLNLAVVWTFVIIIVALVGFVFFKKGYQKNFVGYVESKMQNKTQKRQESIAISPGQHNSKAEVSLSIRGEKQEVTIITLKIKNMAAVKKNQEDGSAYESVKKAINVAEDQKAAIYENNDIIFCIFSALRTKTFSNEMTALKVSKRMMEIIEEHNKVFKQKIDFGIAINNGTIVAKQEKERFKFMAMSNVMTEGKKIAHSADNEILLGTQITDKLRASIKVEKHRRDNIDVYSVKEIKDSEQHQKFLKGFMKRMEKGK